MSNSLSLTKEEVERYGRHILLPEVGKEGQIKLKKAKVLLVGTGGLGSPSLIYLSAAGVGTLGIIDPDKVEFSNLHRQVIHYTTDVGKPKVISAQEKINQLNPHVKIITHETRLNAKNAIEIIKDYDLVIDGTDNFSTRYVINDACILLKKPFIYGGIFRFEGQCSVFGFKDGPCYRCFFEEPPGPGEIPSCAEAGVIGVLPGIIGLLQSNEAIKIICQIGEPLKGRLLIFDALATQFREIQIKKNPSCAMCGHNQTIHQPMDYDVTCNSPSSSPVMTEDAIPAISVHELKEIIDERLNKIYLLDVREQKEWDIAYINGAVLKPTSSFEKNYQDVPKNKPVYIYCKFGGRSANAVKFLKSKGYSNCMNVKGGIDAWAKEIDTKMAKY